MRTRDAKQMAEAELKSHGLDQWSFSWMAERTRRRLGQCVQKKKRVQLSPWYARQNTKKHVRGVVLHEVAHALVGPGKGHGAEWKAKCVEIGAAPERRYGSKGRQPPVNRLLPKWVARCCDCGHTIRRGRLSEWAERGVFRHATCVTLLRWIRLDDPELGSAILDAGRTVRWPARSSNRRKSVV